MSEITLRPSARRTRRSAAASLALALGAGSLAGVGAVTTAETAQAAETTYTVRSGDGWYAVSRNTGVPLSTLFSLNGMTINTMLHAGMVLKTGSSTTTAPAPSTTTSGTYTVRSGDGWYAVSRNTGVPLSTLFSLNGMTINTVLHAGMVLKTSGTTPVERTVVTTPTVTNKQAAIDYVVNKVNDPNTYYLWGGSGPYGFDCSGLMQQAFAQAGISIPRSGGLQYSSAKSYVPVSEAQPGDLVFYADLSTGNIFHVAMYVGNGRLAHALNEDAGLVFTDTTIMKSYMVAMAARY